MWDRIWFVKSETICEWYGVNQGVGEGIDTYGEGKNDRVKPRNERGGGVNQLRFSLGGWFGGKGAIQHPNIYNIFFSGNVTLGS